MVCFFTLEVLFFTLEVFFFTLKVFFFTLRGQKSGPEEVVFTLLLIMMSKKYAMYHVWTSGYGLDGWTDVRRD